MSELRGRPVLDSPILAMLLRLGLGGVFLAMALVKLQSPPDFVRVLGAYHMLPVDPSFLIPFLALWMLWLELVLGLCLLLGLFPRGAAALASIMLVSFTTAVLLRGLTYVEAGTPFMEVRFDCGCGAGVVRLWLKLLENSALILATLYLWQTRARPWTLLSLERRPRPATT